MISIILTDRPFRMQALNNINESNDVKYWSIVDYMILLAINLILCFLTLFLNKLKIPFVTRSKEFV